MICVKQRNNSIKFKKMIDEKLQKKVCTAEYKDKLESMSLNITRASEVSKNEATVVSAFEINLYAFMNSNLELSFLPEKEKTIDTFLLLKRFQFLIKHKRKFIN